jgi:4-azaleucine resistance transporter AzlC
VHPDGFAAGTRASLPVVLGYLSIGFAAGIVQKAAGLSVAEIMLMSLVLYAGSAQFVAAGMIAALSPASAVIVTVFFVNLRHLLLSAALAPHLRAFPAWKNALVGAQLTDETFVVAWGRASGAGLAPGWMLGLNLSAYATWALANLAGAMVGDGLGNIRALGLDFALAGMFGALLALQIVHQANKLAGIAVAGLAAAIAVLVALELPGNWNIVIATFVAAGAGLALEKKWKSGPKS